jgi:branched-chain amino acid transport system ATP-binding protein
VPKTDPILVMDNVTRRFGGLTAVDVEHLEIPRNAITALIGPNGAGKTTLFNLLCGFDKPNSGDWSFDGKNLSGIPFTVFGTVVRRFFTFAVPVAFVAYLPALALLGRTDPLGLPGWLSWAAAPVAAVAWVAALAVWRTGVRHYVGAGS